MYSLIPVVCAQDITALVRALPGSVAQGLIWGIMAIGVFLTFKILDFADLTVDGTMATGGVVTVMLILKGWNPLAAVAVAFVAGMLAGTRYSGYFGRYSYTAFIIFDKSEHI